MTAPTIVISAPLSGTTITSTASLNFSVTDADGFSALLVTCRLSGTNILEVVHDGSSFGPMFSSSVRSAVANGYSYQVLRTGGWGASPQVTIYAVDSSGSINT